MLHIPGTLHRLNVMIDAATKIELIKKIAALPESSRDEAEDRSAEIQKLHEMQKLLADTIDIVNGMLEHEEQRAKNWQTTVEAMEAARRGETKSFDSADEMMAWLHADEDADA
jgi:hypothetical protein